MTTYKGLPVRAVTVRAEVEFTGYVNADLGIAELCERLGREVADAVEYHAPHLSESEEGDALIALVKGGAPERQAVVEVTDIDEAPHVDTDNVGEDVAHTEAWICWRTP